MSSEENAKEVRQNNDQDLQAVLRKSLTDLQGDIDRLNKAIAFYENDPKKLTMLIGARSKVFNQLFECASMIADPKLRRASKDARSLDFARMIERTKNMRKEKEESVAKLVEKANQQKS